MTWLRNLLIVLIGLAAMVASHFLAGPTGGVLTLVNAFAGPVGFLILALGCYALAGLWVAVREPEDRRLRRLRHAKTMGWGAFALGLMGTYVAVIKYSSDGPIDTAAIILAMGSSLMGLAVFFSVMIGADLLAPGADGSD